MDKVKPPENLQSLEFGEIFNQAMDNVKLPGNLQSIEFGYALKLPEGPCSCLQSLAEIQSACGQGEVTEGRSQVASQLIYEHAEAATWSGGDLGLYIEASLVAK